MTVVSFMGRFLVFWSLPRPCRKSSDALLEHISGACARAAGAPCLSGMVDVAIYTRS